MQPTGLSRTPVRHEPCGFFFLDMHLNIAVLCTFYERALNEKALTYSKTEREPQRRRERECRAPDESTPVDGIHSKTAIDKWHNESTVPNVREPSVSPLRSKWGETREEGVVIHLICSHSLITKKNHKKTLLTYMYAHNILKLMGMKPHGNCQQVF